MKIIVGKSVANVEEIVEFFVKLKITLCYPYLDKWVSTKFYVMKFSLLQ